MKENSNSLFICVCLFKWFGLLQKYYWGRNFDVIKTFQNSQVSFFIIELWITFIPIEIHLISFFPSREFFCVCMCVEYIIVCIYIGRLQKIQCVARAPVNFCKFHRHDTIKAHCERLWCGSNHSNELARFIMATCDLPIYNGINLVDKQIAMVSF